MQVWASSLSIYVVAWLALAFVGYGITALTVPPQIRRYQLLLAPFVGYSTISILFHLLNTTFLAGRECIWMVFGLAAAVNGYVGIRRRGDLLLPKWTEIVAAGLISLSVYLIAASPIISYGYSTVVGTNGDVEQYLSVAEYTGRFTIPEISLAYSNPLREAALDLTHGTVRGFDYLLYFVGALVRQPLHSSFAPLLAFLLSIGSLGMYVFSRTTLSLRWRLSAFAVLTVGLNGLILWAALFNYGRQIASLALLPVTALTIVTWYEERTWRSTLFLGLLLSAVVLTYWPPALACLATVAALAAFAVLKTPRRAEMSVSFLILTALCVALAFPGLGGLIGSVKSSYRALWDFSPISSQPLPDNFLPLGHLYGFGYYVWPKPEPLQQLLGSVGSIVIGPWQWLATATAICLGTYALCREARTRGLVLASLLLPHIILLLVARWVISDRYSYFKALTFCAFLASGLAVLGLVHAWRWVESKGRLPRLSIQAGLSLFAVVTVALAGCNAYLVTRHFFSQPRSAYSTRALEADALNAVIPPGATLYVSDAPRLQGAPMGVLSYLLTQNPLYGQIVSAWGSLHNSCPHGTVGTEILPADDKDAIARVNLCDYAVLAPNEDPADKGYGGNEAVWINRDIGVYRRDATLARMDFGQTAQYRQVAEGSPLEFTVMERPSEAAESTSSSGRADFSWRQLALQVGSFGSTQLFLTIDGKERVIYLPSGLSVYETEPLEMPISVSLSSAGDEPVYVTWVDVREPETGLPLTSKQDDVVLLQVQHERTASRLKTTIQYRSAEAMHKPVWLELREEIFGLRGNDGRLIHRWPLDSRAGEIEFEVDLDRLTLEPTPLDVSEAETGKQLTIGKGQPVICLWLGQEGTGGDDSLTRVMPLYELTSEKGRATQFQEINVPLAYARVSIADRLDATFGDVARLLGYTLEPSSMWPGGVLTVTLYWQPLKEIGEDYVTFVHLLDGKSRMWGQGDKDLRNGPSGATDSDGLVIRTYEIPIAEDVQPGRYAIAAGIYRRSDMERLLVTVGSSQMEDLVILDWLKIGRREPLSAQDLKIQQPLPVDFEGGVSLLGYDLGTSTDINGDALRVKLHWQSQAWVEEDYTVFVHLVDEENEIVAQDDSQPVQARYPTSIWAPNEIVTDEHSLVLAGVPPGEYRIEIGLYSLPTMERLNVVSEEGSEADHVVLTTTSVNRTEGDE